MKKMFSFSPNKSSGVLTLKVAGGAARINTFKIKFDFYASTVHPLLSVIENSCFHL